jgi:hypothetical protein
VGVAVAFVWGVIVMTAAYRSSPSFWPAVQEGLRLAPAFGICAGLITALGKGGAQILRHYILRWLLSHEPGAPKRIQRLLDMCASLNILQRSGGAYSFLHDLLRDHCAIRRGTEAAVRFHSAP